MLKGLLIVLIGYAVPKLVSVMAQKLGLSRSAARLSVTIAGAATVLCLILLLARQNLVYVAAVVIIVLISVVDSQFGWASWVYEKVKIAKGEVKKAASHDKSWGEEDLLALAKQTLEQYTKDWPSMNLRSLHTYATKRFAYQAELMFNMLQQTGYRHIVSTYEGERFSIENVHNVIDREQDHFAVLVEGLEESVLVNNKKAVVNERRGAFTELWEFERESGQWRLDGIERLGESIPEPDSSLKAFASKAGFGFQQDWAWLAMANDGLLFRLLPPASESVTGYAVGVQRNILTQLLSLTVEFDTKTTLKIASVHIPRKHYPLIIRHRTIDFLDMSLMRLVDIDWPAFNENYEVFADMNEPVENLQIMKILKPDFIDTLIQLPFDLSIEIIDQRVNVFTTSPDADWQQLIEMCQLIESTIFAA